MLEKHTNTTRSSTANLAKDYLSCILYPHIPFKPVPSPSDKARANVIATTETSTIAWYLYCLNIVPFNGFLIESVRTAQKTKLYSKDEVLPMMKIMLTAVQDTEKLAGSIGYLLTAK